MEKVQVNELNFTSMVIHRVLAEKPKRKRRRRLSDKSSCTSTHLTRGSNTQSIPVLHTYKTSVQTCALHNQLLQKIQATSCHLTTE